MKAVIGIVVVAVVALVTVFFCSTRIEPGFIGVKFYQYGDNKGLEKNVETVSGRVFYNPMTQDIYMFPTYTQNVSWSYNPDEGGPNESLTFNVEGQPINVDLGIMYSIEPTKVTNIFVKYKRDIEYIQNNYLRTYVRESFVEVAERYKLDTFLINQAKFIEEVKANLTNKISDEGFIIETLTFASAPRYNEKVAEYIQNKLGATQKAETMKRELEQTQAAMAKLNAQAEGEKQAKITAAEGEAEATIIAAKAEAEAIKLKQTSITDKYLELQRIDKWDGTLPKIVTGDKTGTLLNVGNLD